MRVLNTQQMREADRRTIDEIGIPSVVLMENAGRQAVAAMEAAFEDLPTTRVGVMCGRGNNGGDGFVVARTLIQRGIETSVFLLGSVADVRGDARTNLEVLGRIGLTVVVLSFWVGIVGVAVAFPAIYGLANFASILGTRVLLPTWLMMTASSITLTMAMLSGLAALRSLRLMEPATLLR